MQISLVGLLVIVAIVALIVLIAALIKAIMVMRSADKILKENKCAIDMTIQKMPVITDHVEQITGNMSHAVNSVSGGIQMVKDFFKKK